MSEKYYIGIRAKSIEESHKFQEALFELGFSWATSGLALTNHTNFYARKHDQTLITCYHDPAIDEESEFLTLDQVKSYEAKAESKEG
ncbi:hypothetical protein [Acinetobacter baumannii]|uniref:hypothetical protein n=1 Tax=Acinetobacter baumannii TaxID=470 RepID=UPI003A8C366B